MEAYCIAYGIRNYALRKYIQYGNTLKKLNNGKKRGTIREMLIEKVIMCYLELDIQGERNE